MNLGTDFRTGANLTYLLRAHRPGAEALSAGSINYSDA
jgi:hypothetical protein